MPIGFDALHYWLNERVVRPSQDPGRPATDCVGVAPKLLDGFGVGAEQATLTALAYLADLSVRYLADRQAEAGARLGAPGRWLIPDDRGGDRRAVSAKSVSPPAKRAAHAISVTAGRVTAPLRMLPGFLIVGAQRCGTTSMYRALAEHPSVRKAVLHKGVHYFDMNYDRGLGWYRAHFPLTSRAPAGAAQTFESSPYYLFHPLAAERIAADLPGVKLIVLVRDPVERAYSAYTHEFARGFETEPFEAAIELEPGRLNGEAERIAAEPGLSQPQPPAPCLPSARTVREQLDRLEQLFDRADIHVVDSGDFFTKPEPVYDGVLDFLGLASDDYPQFERHNARPRSAIPEALRARLDEHFVSFDEQLIHWLDQVPSWRR